MAKLVSSCGCGVVSDSTSELVLNDGQGTAVAVGSPFAAKFAHMLAGRYLSLDNNIDEEVPALAAA